MNQDYNNYTNITSCSVAGVTTSVTTDACVLKAIIVNNISTSYTIGIVDNTTGTTVNVGQLQPTVTGNYLYNCRMGLGLRIVSKGKETNLPDFTVVWRQ